MIEYLSEIIAYEIIDEDSAMDVLKVAEDKVKYLGVKSKWQIGNKY